MAELFGQQWADLASEMVAHDGTIGEKIAADGLYEVPVAVTR